MIQEHYLVIIIYKLNVYVGQEKNLTYRKND